MTKPSRWGQVARGVRETAADLTSPLRQLRQLSALPLQARFTETSRRISHQQFRTLIHHYPAYLLTDFAGGLLWLVVVWFYEPGWAAAIWGGAFAGSMVGMVVLWQLFSREKPPDEALWVWERRWGQMNWARGLVWGLASLPAPDDVVVTPYLALGSLLVLVTTLRLHAIYRPSLAWMVVPCALVTGIGFVLRGGWLHAVIGLYYLAAVVLLVSLARTQNTLMTQVMVASEERVALLEKIDAQRAAAEQANDAKTRFLAAVSHDLRQPMHSIALLSSALRQRCGDRGEVIDQLSASVQRMNGLLHALPQESAAPDRRVLA